MVVSAGVSTRILFLGPPRIEHDNTLVHLERRKAVGLLAYLALSRQPHSRETLAAMFWPDHERAREYAYLRNTLWTISRALGEDWAEIEGDTIKFSRNASQTVSVDVHEFSTLIASSPPLSEITEGLPPDRLRTVVETLGRAVALYRGDFLAGFSLRDSADFEEWQFFQAEELKRLYGSALQRLGTAYSVFGEYDAALGAARRWSALDPLHEPAHRLLMELYERSGQHAAALRQYREVTRLLETELGTPPEPETTRLHETIQARRLAGSSQETKGAHEPRATVAPIPTLEFPVNQPVVSQLPPQPTPFIGRDNELAEIARLLDDPECRLLTLIGPGGIGKTRLSIQAAASYSGVARFISLAPICCDDFLVPTMAGSLGIAPYGRVDQKTQLFEALRNANLLLVLDNFEHLLNTADLLSELLAAAPTLKLLVTSRERLNLQEEWLFEVGGLAYPSAAVQHTSKSVDAVADYSAVRLFVQSARRIRPGFRLTEAEAPYVAEICRFAEGAPLAIELAATWMQMLSPAEVAQEIKKNVDFLATTMRNVPERHRSLRAVFEHSWATLTEEQQTTLSQLSVFRAGFKPEAAQAVAGASLHSLLALVGKSLLRRSEGRFEMHELLRQYAELKMTPEEHDAAEERHTSYYLNLLRDSELPFKSRDQVEVLHSLAAETDNLRAAWRFAVLHRDIAALNQAAEMLVLLYMTRSSFQECLEMLERALAVLAADSADPDERLLMGRLLAFQAWTQLSIGQYAALQSSQQRSAALLAEFPGSSLIAGPLLWLADSMNFPGAPGDRAELLAREALAIFEARRDRWGSGMALRTIAESYHLHIRYPEAREYYDRCLAVFREIGHPMGVALALSGIGWNLSATGDFPGALRALDEALPYVEMIGDKRLITTFRYERMCYAADLVSDEYVQTLRDSLQVYEELNSKPQIGWALYNLGWVELNKGYYDQAEPYFTRCLVIFQEMSDKSDIIWSYNSLGMVAVGQRAFDTARHMANEALREGAGLDFPWGRAGALYVLGDVALYTGDLEAARGHYSEALRIAHEAQSTIQTLRHLSGIADLHATEGRYLEAAALAVLIIDHQVHQGDFVRRAREILARCENKLAADEMDAVRQQVKAWLDLPLNEVVNAVLGAVSAS